MPTYKLTYYPIRARAEVVRYVFAEAGVPYEDIAISFGDWPKHKANLLFGQIPELNVDGKRLTQSNAIARYLAVEYGLAGKSKFEAAECDMYSGIVEDIFVLLVRNHFEPDAKAKEEQLKKFMEETGPLFFTEFERILSKNKAGFLVGSGVTYADLSLLGGLEFFENCYKEVAKKLISKYPNLQKHRQKIAALPKIAAHISKRPKADL